MYKLSNLIITTPLEAPESWPLLTCGRCSELTLYSKYVETDAKIAGVVDRWSLLGDSC